MLPGKVWNWDDVIARATDACAPALRGLVPIDELLTVVSDLRAR
jgi:hypothetical protein